MRSSVGWAVGLAEAAVIECEDIEVEGVEEGEFADVGGKVAGAIVEEEEGGGLGTGGCVGGDPPGGEGGTAGGGGVEVNGLEGDGGGAGDFGGGVENKLPGTLPDEQADGEIGAKERGENGEAKGLEEPARVYDFGRSGGGGALSKERRGARGRAGARALWSGSRHGTSSSVAGLGWGGGEDGGVGADCAGRGKRRRRAS